MLGVCPIILVAVDADFWVRLRLRALETVAFAVVDFRTIKPERKVGVFGNCLPMFDGSVEHEANVVGGVYAEWCRSNRESVLAFTSWLADSVTRHQRRG
jgi:hypothetical protein